MPHAADPHQPSSFGRGWIPASRDIGLPDDVLPALGAKGQTRRVSVPQADGEEVSSALPLASAEAALLHPNQFTPTRIALFLEHLSRHGQVRAAAQVAGVSSQTAYVRRRRDPAFAAAWDAGLLHAREAAEQVLATRALHGTTETIWFRGEAVGERRRFDARLLLAHLARLDARAAQAPRAIHHLAEDFDRMLLALAEGADVAAATGWTDPARDRFLKAFEARADADYKEANPFPDDDAPDEVWDDWQEELNDHLEAARRAAPEAWDDAQSRREATLHALFGEEEERKESQPSAGKAAPPTPRHLGLDPGSRLATEAPDAQAETRTTPEPCKPRKSLAVLKCGTAPSALLPVSLNWPLQAPRPLPATPVPLPPAPAQPWLAAATGRPW